MSDVTASTGADVITPCDPPVPTDPRDAADSLGTRGLFLRFRFHFNVYTLNLYNVVEGLSGSEKQPVVKFLRCALPSYD